MSTVFESLNGLQGAMDFHRHRHAVLSGNVANVDTPGFRSFDLARPETSLEVGELSRTSRAHMRATGEVGEFEKFVDDGAPAGVDGNTVSLERELAKVDANRVRYTTTAELVSRRVALLRYTATDGMG